ncbi:MAG TPA: PAS domain-containing protein [Gemmatimonadaceae bacterium]|nr:PAS domain-containing protein [Gemmatimonadaceae bacterium]
MTSPVSLLTWLRASLARRMALLALALALSVGIRISGLVAVPTLLLVVLALWLSVAIVFREYLHSRPPDESGIRLHFVAQVLDVLGVLIVTHLIGATLWYAPIVLALSVSLGGQTLPSRSALALGAIAAFGYAVTLTGEINGWFAYAGPLAGASPPTASGGVVAVLLVSFVLITIVIIQGGFFRQVTGIEAQHQRLLETATDVLATFDRDGRFLTVNGAFERILGWGRDVTLNAQAIDFVVESDREMVAEHFRATWMGETRMIDARIRAADGEVRILSLTGAPIRDPAGGIQAILGIGRDVTQRRQDSARLADSERQLRFLVQSINETVCTFDTEGRLTAAYGRWAAAFRRGADNVAGLHPTAIFGPRVGGAVAQILREVLAGQTRETDEELVVNGEPRRFHLWFAPLRDDVGATIGVTGVAYDVTEQHRAEQERDALRAHVEESRRIEAIGRLVSGVAHEINNPLATILTFAEQLRAEARSPVDAAALDAIHAQAMRSRAVVRDLLAFVRPAQQRPATVLRPAPLLMEIAQTFRPHVASLGVELMTDIKDDDVCITADAPGFEQVVTNLVLNAAQSTEAGGKISLRTASTADRFVLVVEDSGPGIPEAAMPHLFEPFFTTKGVGKGAGLGLSVVMGIVQQHGGTVRAENRPQNEGPGARFVVEIPRTAGPAPEPRRTPLPGQVLASSVGAQRRVLLVDDEESIRQSLRRFFTRKSWEVFEASDGGMALDVLRQQGADSFALILCDLRMPGLGGPELHAQLQVEFPRLLERLVIVTGDVVSNEASAFLAMSKVRVLEKPFELKTLIALAESMLEASGAETPASESA